MTISYSYSIYKPLLRRSLLLVLRKSYNPLNKILYHKSTSSPSERARYGYGASFDSPAGARRASIAIKTFSLAGSFGSTLEMHVGLIYESDILPTSKCRSLVISRVGVGCYISRLLYAEYIEIIRRSSKAEFSLTEFLLIFAVRVYTSR